MSSADDKKLEAVGNRSDLNLYLFAAIVAMQYLSAPVIYIGITQGSLLDQLGANAVLANLPGASYFVMATLVAVTAWAFPKVRHLKPILVTCYGLCGVVIGATALVLASSAASNEMKIGMVILQSAVTGATIPTAIAFIWEVLGRTTESSKRGIALGLAYGVGPVLAAVGSLIAQLILAGHFELGPLRLENEVLSSPLNYALLFALVSPVMIIASILSSRFQIPVPDNEVERKPVKAILDISLAIVVSIIGMACSLFANLFKEMDSTGESMESSVVETSYRFFSRLLGMSSPETLASWLMSASSVLMIIAVLLFAYHFRDLLSVRLIRIVAIATMFFYVTNVIPTNMNLYSRDVLGVDPTEYAGYQNLMRFSFKALAGLALGWLLVRTNPRSGVLVTASLFGGAMLWAIFATGKAYLLAFGIYGAGELIGVYAPNYMLSVTNENQMKRGQVMMNLLMGPVGQMAIVFGWVADTIKESETTLFGLSPSALGFKTTFVLAIGFLAIGIAITLKYLPRDPKAKNYPEPINPDLE
ncbi:MAG: hypothetical protein ACJZ8O_04120 [Pirellulaceae bacterium]